MRDLVICTGGSRWAAVWKAGKISFDGLCSRLKKPQRTAETVDQYQKMSKAEREKAKDHGGFVMGTLKGTRRKKSEVVSRSGITLDGDKVRPDFFDLYQGNHRFLSVVYTTHSHTRESPRVRIVIPATRDMTPEETNAIARYIAADIGIEQIDPCSFEINQLMYWPTCPSDGEYVCEQFDGEELDPDEFLKEHPNWKDITTLPRTPDEKEAVSRQQKEQEDPLKKNGIVGAFCRTYSIQAAISKFLSDIYAPSATEGRYSYIPGEGSAGVVVYEDKFSYSHHATDPAQGRLLNAFDLVRLHRFGDMDEKASFNSMRSLAEKDPLVKETIEKEKAAQAKEEFTKISSSWEEPIPFGRHSIMPFPVDALPEEIRDYVSAISESVQTPVDMAGCAALAVIAASIQGKFVIRGKPDWTEPLNLYITEIAPPSERKSAIQHAMVKPVSDYENQYNKRIAPSIETSKMQRRILERRQKAVEDQVVKGKATQQDMDDIAREITDYREKKPLRLFADDITPEKLASVLAENDGRMALLSSEAGIFDTLSGVYSKSVNIDVMLKSYSGDQIRVDRIGRESENILNPALTVLLMAQPNVISRVLGNEIFRGRGLTARFLYSMPASAVGTRRYRSKPVPEGVYSAYEQRVFNMLEDEYSSKPEVITLSPEADALLERFSQTLEPKLAGELAEISDWCGKLAGNTLRIAGLLCRAGTCRSSEFLSEPSPLVVDGQTMKNAIRLGRYFLNHAQAVFNVLPENAMFQNAYRVLKMLSDRKLKEFSRRDAMRNCQTFKRVDEIQPVLDFLEDYGYIATIENASSYGKGRPPMPRYAVNPWVEQYLCHFVIPPVIPHE